MPGHAEKPLGLPITRRAFGVTALVSGASAATLQLDLCNHWPPFVPDATAVYFREEPGRFLVHLEYAAASTPATGATCASSSTA